MHAQYIACDICMHTHTYTVVGFQLKHALSLSLHGILLGGDQQLNYDVAVSLTFMPTNTYVEI